MDNPTPVRYADVFLLLKLLDALYADAELLEVTMNVIEARQFPVSDLTIPWTIPSKQEYLAIRERLMDLIIPF